MNRLHQYIKRKRLLVICAVVTLFIYSGGKLCAALRDKNKKVSFDDYAGSASCRDCHKQICDSQMMTAHYLTSEPAEKKFIKGSFNNGKNIFVYNKFMQVKLDEKDGRFMQTASASGMDYEAHSFDVVIGSGRKGQTYLYWSNNSLYQLPVSYYTPLNSWCNSPGFPVNFIQFDRLIQARCLECHGTYASYNSDDKNTYFDSTQIIYSVTCERCHGPALKHVEYYKQHPKDTLARFITKIKYLSRQQQLDACALCHSGARQAVQPAFTFQTGDVLENYSLPTYNTDSANMLDVHGNQFGLLASSKCFIQSAMTCSSCHNTHQNERNNTVVYSQRCQTCHADVKHNFQLSSKATVALNNNCIDCHMPVLASKKIILQLSGEQKMVPDYVRTHRITIYEDETKEWLKKNR